MPGTSTLTPKLLAALRQISRLGLALAALLFTASALPAQTWSLQWSDEFNGPANAPPSASNWTYDTGNNNGWGNGEAEFYCAPGSNALPCSRSQPNIFQDGAGNLVIRAIHTNGQWTSGRLLTSGKHAFQYGRMEARLKLQSAHGFWPAFWMLGDNIHAVGWPQAGEQDIIEWVQSYGPTTTSSTVHGPGYSGGHGPSQRFTFPDGGRIDDSDFHTYGVVWSPNRMQFYRDNAAQPFFTLTPAQIPAGAQWVYNNPFFILLNFAIGGPDSHFSGPTDASTPGTGTMLVDYVRVYQSSPSISAASRYSVQNASTGLCLANSTQGTPPQETHCLGAVDQQQWQFTPAGNGYYNVTNRQGNNGWDATAISSAHSAEASVQTHGRNAGLNQQWMPVSLGNDTYKFVARNSRLCLEISAGATAPQQNTCNGTIAQAFILSQQP